MPHDVMQEQVSGIVGGLKDRDQGLSRGGVEAAGHPVEIPSDTLAPPVRCHYMAGATYAVTK